MEKRASSEQVQGINTLSSVCVNASLATQDNTVKHTLAKPDQTVLSA